MELRICKSCNEEKLITEFQHIRRENYTYVLLRCKECENLKRSLKKNHKRKSNLREFIVRSLDNAKQRSKVKGLKYSLSIQWYLDNLPDRCPVFDTKLDFTSTNDYEKPSLDRINPNEGYTPENTRIISWQANNIRNRWSLEDLKKVVAYLEQNKL